MAALFGIIGSYSEHDIELMSNQLTQRGTPDPTVHKCDFGFIAVTTRYENGNSSGEAHPDLAMVIDGYLGSDQSPDTILAQYDSMNLSSLNGLHAGALLEKQTGKLVLFRDPSGARPLYYTKTVSRFAFASSPEALLALQDVSCELNPEGILLYTAMICPADPVTIYKNINMLSPGYHLDYANQNWKQNPYWIAPWKPVDQSLDPKSAENPLLEAMKASVKDALPDDPDKTGFFLSGGTDTGAVVALAAECGFDPVNTYTIGYEGTGTGYEDYNEFHYAKLISKHYGTKHHEFFISPDALKKSLPGIIAGLHQPSGDAINTYLVASTLPRSLTTVLTGTAGDEVFIGSHWFRQQSRLINSYAKWEKLPRAIRSILLSSAALLPGGIGHRLKRLDALKGGAPAQYRHFKFMFSGPARNNIFSSQFKAQLLDLNAPERIVDKYHVKHVDLDPINAMENLLFMHEVCNLQLRDVDSMSHAHGIEARSPLADKRILQVLCQVSGIDKAPDGKLRQLMFDTLGKRLLHETKYRPKMSFIVPMDLWARRDLKPLIETLLSRDVVEKRGVFNPDAVEMESTAFFKTGRERHPFKIWNLAFFELWCRYHIDQPVGTTIPEHVEDLL